MAFQVVEAVDELSVGSFKGVVGIDVIEAGSVDEAEHDVSKFCLRLVCVHVFDLCFKLADFFFHLFPNLTALFPVKTHMARFVLNAIGFDE